MLSDVYVPVDIPGRGVENILILLPCSYDEMIEILCLYCKVSSSTTVFRFGPRQTVLTHQYLRDCYGNDIERFVEGELSARHPLRILFPDNTGIRLTRGSRCTRLRVELIAQRNHILSDTSLSISELALFRRGLYISMFGVIDHELLDYINANEALQSILPASKRLYDQIGQVSLPLVVSNSSESYQVKQWQIYLTKTNNLVQSSKVSFPLLEHLRNRPSLLLPADMDELFRFDQVFSHIVSFCHLDAVLPESQYVCSLWVPIIKAAMDDGETVISTKYIAETLDSNYRKQFVDIVGVLDPQVLPNGHTIPVFSAEAAAERLSDSIKKKGFNSKDKSKHAVFSGSVLLYRLGQFRDHAGIQERLRYYGLLISGTQAQFTLIHPVFGDNHSSDSPDISYIFQTHKHWRIDFACSGNTVCDSSDCRLCHSMDEGYEKKTSISELSSSRMTTPIQENEEDMKAIIQNHWEFEDERIESDSRFSDMRMLNDVCHLGREVLRFLSVFRLIRQSVADLKNSLRETTIASPYRHDPTLLRAVPSSGTTDNSPNKDFNTPKGNQGQMAGLKRKLDDVSCSNSKSITREFSNVIRIEKKKESNEVDMLCLLSACKNVVDLFAWDLSQPDRPILFEEKLVFELPFTEVDALFPIACRFLLDGVEAISVLRQYGIIHRDLSVGNILFSLDDACWKLIDFDLAVYADEEGKYENRNPVKPSGTKTKGFIAPELFQDDSFFSWKTDLYGLGASYKFRFVDPCFLDGHIDSYQPTSSSLEEFEIYVRENGVRLFDELEALCNKSICCEETSRMELNELKYLLLSKYKEISGLFYREENYQDCSWDLVAQSEELLNM